MFKGDDQLNQNQFNFTMNMKQHIVALGKS